MGVRGMSHTRVRLDDVRIDDSLRLGEVGEGLRIMFFGLAAERIDIAARALGCATRSFEEARAYAAERHQFGKPLRALQAVSHKISTDAHHHRRRPAAGAAGRPPLRRGAGHQGPRGGQRGLQRGVVDRQAVLRRAVLLGLRHGHAGLRRARLRAGHRRRGHVPRRPGVPLRRRHRRDPAPHHPARRVQAAVPSPARRRRDDRAGRPCSCGPTWPRPPSWSRSATSCGVARPAPHRGVQGPEPAGRPHRRRGRGVRAAPGLAAGAARGRLDRGPLAGRVRRPRRHPGRVRRCSWSPAARPGPRSRSTRSA